MQLMKLLLLLSLLIFTTGSFAQAPTIRLGQRETTVTNAYKQSKALKATKPIPAAAASKDQMKAFKVLKYGNKAGYTEYFYVHSTKKTVSKQFIMFDSDAAERNFLKALPKNYVRIPDKDAWIVDTPDKRYVARHSYRVVSFVPFSAEAVQNSF